MVSCERRCEPSLLMAREGSEATLNVSKILARRILLRFPALLKRVRPSDNLRFCQDVDEQSLLRRLTSRFCLRRNSLRNHDPSSHSRVAASDWIGGWLIATCFKNSQKWQLRHSGSLMKLGRFRKGGRKCRTLDAKFLRPREMKTRMLKAMGMALAATVGGVAFGDSIWTAMIPSDHGAKVDASADTSDCATCHRNWSGATRWTTNTSASSSFALPQANLDCLTSSIHFDGTITFPDALADPDQPVNLREGGTTLVLTGLALGGMGFFARRRANARQGTSNSHAR